MKKQKVELGKKLFLSKTTISLLTNNEQKVIQGGATEVSVCLQCATINTCGVVCFTVGAACPSVPRTQNDSNPQCGTCCL